MFSPLGASDRLDKYIQDLFNTFAGDWVYPDERKEDVAVLLLTDEVVDAVLQGQWPAPYSFHASILDDLLVHTPRALFIDFYWMNKLKPGSDYLVDVLKQYKDASVPVYLSAPSSEWLAQFWPELTGLVIPVSPHVVMDPMDFVARSYPQEYRGLPSAAFAISRDLLEVVPDYRGDMDVFWGTTANQRNLAWMETADQADGSLLSALVGGFDAVKTPIPYTTTVFVRDLLNPVAATEDEALEELDDHLKNRVVIYGASLAGIQDVVFTPTRAILPGAYYHAMAIDNLLTWGDDFKAGTPRWLVSGLESLTLPLIQFLLLLPIAGFVCFRGDSPSPAFDRQGFVNHPTFIKRLGALVRCRLRPHLPAIATTSALLAWVTFACWLQFSVLHLSAATWAGFLEIIGLGAVIERLALVQRASTFFPKLWETLKQLTGDNDEQDKPRPGSGSHSVRDADQC